jgi:hypothetical protein
MTAERPGRLADTDLGLFDRFALNPEFDFGH